MIGSRQHLYCFVTPKNNATADKNWFFCPFPCHTLQFNLWSISSLNLFQHVYLTRNSFTIYIFILSPHESLILNLSKLEFPPFLFYFFPIKILHFFVAAHSLSQWLLCGIALQSIQLKSQPIIIKENILIYKPLGTIFSLFCALWCSIIHWLLTFPSWRNLVYSTGSFNWRRRICRTKKTGSNRSQILQWEGWNVAGRKLLITRKVSESQRVHISLKKKKKKNQGRKLIIY